MRDITFGNSAAVCIITPGQIGSNPRVVKEAQALHQAGYRASVVATRMLDAVEERDRALMRDIGWRLDRIDMTGRLAWRVRRLAQVASRSAFAATSFSGFADFGFSAFTSALFSKALTIPADLYIAHYVAALPAAATLRNGAAYAFDAEDHHLGDSPDAPGHALEKRIIRGIEGRYLQGAAYVTAASPLIAEAYVESYGIARPTVVLNVFPRANAPAAPAPRGNALPGPSLYWFSQTIGTGRGLETAIAAIAGAASRPHLYLRRTPAMGYEAKLRALAAREGVAERLHFLPSAPPDEMERLGAKYDLGYVAETTETRNRQIAFTNKLFSYLTGGLPILASNIEAYRLLAAELGAAMALFFPRRRRQSHGGGGSIFARPRPPRRCARIRLAAGAGALLLGGGAGGFVVFRRGRS